MNNLIVAVGGKCFRNELRSAHWSPELILRFFLNGGQALSFIEQLKPVLIVAEYRLPDIDGLSFMYRLRRIAPDSQRILYGLDAGVKCLDLTTLNSFAGIGTVVGVAELTMMARDTLSVISASSQVAGLNKGLDCGRDQSADGVLQHTVVR